MNARTFPTAAAVALLLLGSSAAAAPTGTAITLEKAESIALARVPGGKVEESERDQENTKVVYEIEVRGPDGREHDFTIDAEDGRILSEEVDD